MATTDLPAIWDRWPAALKRPLKFSIRFYMGMIAFLAVAYAFFSTYWFQMEYGHKYRMLSYEVESLRDDARRLKAKLADCELGMRLHTPYPDSRTNEIKRRDPPSEVTTWSDEADWLRHQLEGNRFQLEPLIIKQQTYRRRLFWPPKDE